MTPKDRSQEDTIWVAMNTSRTSGGSWCLAGSLEKTHGTAPGAQDQTQSKSRETTSKGCREETQQRDEGPQSLIDEKKDHHLIP
jgi:hypothetical protein